MGEDDDIFQKTICISGRQYYWKHYHNHIVVKLNEYGKPMRCTSTQKDE
jgi:hypothetical protein